MAKFQWDQLTPEQKAAAAAKADRIRLLGTEEAVPAYVSALLAATDTGEWENAFKLLGELRSYVKAKQKAKQKAAEVEHVCQHGSTNPLHCKHQLGENYA